MEAAMKLKSIVKILSIIAPLAGVNSKHVELVIAILNIIAEETVEATEQ